MNLKISPLVSIITPSYNSEKFISETIVSIQKQTYHNWELLITDDCSSDSTIEIVNTFIKNDKRIKLFVLNNNSGAGVARNNSIKHSQGRYIAFCDSDDQFLPYKLDKQIAFMQNNDLQFTYSSYKVCNEQGKIIGNVTCPKEISYKKMLNNNYLGCLTAIYDTEKIGKIYMSSIRKRQDWVLWLNILKLVGPTIGVNIPLAIYRNREESISNNKIGLIKYTFKVYHNEMHYNWVKSLFLVIKYLFFYFKKNK
jgi:teichuronic acid biosynthesis glycosyltransferase TuaG